MMWHFYEIPYIPDLELVKYQSLGEQGIDGILERHNRFLRQWQRNTVLIHTTLHFFLSYTHERPKGSRLQIFLAFSSDQTVNFESIDTTKIKNCGAVLSNEVEYEPSVYIEATDSAKYPWLSFVVTGEQLTMTQVSFAIYALYLPTKDSQCTQAVDTIEQNQKYQNRLITLKQAQNPKIKNYIESINEILISGLEAWLNNNNTSSMYD